VEFPYRKALLVTKSPIFIANSHAEYVQWDFHLLEIVVQVLVLLGEYFVPYEVQLADNLRLGRRLIVPGALKEEWVAIRAACCTRKLRRTSARCSMWPPGVETRFETR